MTGRAVWKQALLGEPGRHVVLLEKPLGRSENKDLLRAAGCPEQSVQACLRRKVMVETEKQHVHEREPDGLAPGM